MSPTDEPRKAPESPPGLGDYERLEADLRKAVERLGAEELPLEERLALHARAVRLQDRAEELLRAARRKTDAVERATGPDSPPDGSPSAPKAEEAEPYESLHERLGEVVRRLEEGGDDLTLGEVVRLHAEAHRLAARCEAILNAAQGRIEHLEAGREDAGDEDPPAEAGPDDAEGSGPPAEADDSARS